MNHLINPYNPVMNFLGKLLDCILLNLLWILCSLPLFTLGASTSALYYCTLKHANDSGISLLQDFFHSFRQNFREGTKLSCLIIPIAIAFFFSGRFYRQRAISSPLFMIGFGLYIVFLIVFAIIVLYAFPLLSRYDNSWKGTLKNAFMIGIRYPVCTIVMAAIHFAIYFIAIRYFTPVIFLGEGFAAFLCSYLLKPVFRKLENPEGTPDTENTENVPGNRSGDADHTHQDNIFHREEK